MRRRCFPLAAAFTWIAACAADVRLGDVPSDVSLDEGGAGGDGALADATSAIDGVSGADARASADATTSDGAGPGSDAEVDAADAIADASDATILDAPGDACAVDCKGNPCAGTTCLPLVVATGQNLPLYLTSDDANVYWTTSGHAGTNADPNFVMKLPKSGGAPIVLAQDDGFPRGIVVDATNVYWNDAAEGGAEQIWRASNVDGTGAQVLGFIPAPQDIQGLGASTTTLYAVSGTEVRAYAKTGVMSAGTEITNLLTHGGDVAVRFDNSFIWVGDQTSVAIIDTTTLAFTPVTIPGQKPLAVVETPIDLHDVYYAGGGEVGRVFLDDDSVEPIDTGLTGAVSIQTTGGVVAYSTTNEIRKKTIGAMTSTVLASGLVKGGRIALDTTYVYYADVGAGTINRVPR